MSLQVGDKVRVMENAEMLCGNSYCEWNPDMKDTIGKIGTIEKVCEGEGVGCFRVCFTSLSTTYWFYPEGALEKVYDSTGRLYAYGTLGSWFETETEEEAPLKTKKTFMSIIKDLTKSKEQKALESFGLLNSDNTLNEEGRREFVTFLFQGDAKTAFEAEIVKAYEEKRKKDCK